tara:strand:- start:626 stop:1270 length:645 start_codon:yes stop_codon:yes gene_type:complete
MDYEGFSRKDLIKMLEEANDNVEYYEKQCEAKDEEYERMLEEKNEEISELDEKLRGLQDSWDTIALSLGLIDDEDIDPEWNSFEKVEQRLVEKNEQISELEEKLQLEDEWKESFASEVEASFAKEKQELKKENTELKLFVKQLREHCDLFVKNYNELTALCDVVIPEKARLKNENEEIKKDARTLAERVELYEDFIEDTGLWKDLDEWKEQRTD